MQRGLLNTGWSIAAAGLRRAGRSIGRHVADGREGWTQSVRELRAEADLRHAFAAGQLVPVYEPIVSLATQQVVGFEALTRWRTPEGLGSFGPHVGIAEATGLIVPIGAWILREACHQLLQLDQQNPDANPVWVSVNVSARQLSDPSFLPHLKDLLRDTRVNPDRLKLEITESTVMQDADETALWRLKDLGVCIHMDDFGTGYSSLASLHRFPIDVLKVDRSFIRNTSSCRDYAPVLHAVVALAHNLGIEVVAEGLEESSQVALLRAMACDYGQGYYFGRAVAGNEAIHYLRPPAELAQSA